MRWLFVAALLAASLSGCLSEETPDQATGADDDGAAPVSQDVSFEDTVNILAGTDGLDGCGTQGTTDRAETTWTVAPEGIASGRVHDMSITLTWANAAMDVDLVVYDPDGTEIARDTSFEAGATSLTVPVDGTHDLGDYRIVVLGCTGSGDVQVAGTATATG